jgi:hypothetical protein
VSEHPPPIQPSGLGKPAGSPLVDRLRDIHPYSEHNNKTLCEEAAEAIERLTRERDDALKVCSELGAKEYTARLERDRYYHAGWNDAAHIARKALRPADETFVGHGPNDAEFGMSEWRRDNRPLYAAELERLNERDKVLSGAVDTLTTTLQRVSAERDRLRAALERIVREHPHSQTLPVKIAREALRPADEGKV